MQVDSVRFGVSVGLFLAVAHAAWTVLVAVGWAQPLLNFVFWAHFITPPYHVESFDLMRAAVLVTFAFVTGLVFGSGGGFIWNRIVATS